MPIHYCTQCKSSDNDVIKFISFDSMILKCKHCSCIHAVTPTGHHTITDGVPQSIPEFDDAVKYAKATMSSTDDAVNHPKHYASGLDVATECIMFTRWLNFDMGNAFKYVWRAGNKESFTQDIRKAMWYLDDADVYNISVGKAELIDFLPKSYLDGWKYKALRYILQGKARHAYEVLGEKMQSLNSAS